MTVSEADVRTELLAGLPVTEQRVEVAGKSTALLRGGDGPPLLLLHGGIESGAVVWAPVISRLTETWHVVAPDIPGLGESAPLEQFDEITFAGWLAELIRTTCDEPPVLVAHSLGGSLAARFAARDGQLLRGLVLMGAPGVDRYRMPLRFLVTAIRLDVRPTERNNARFARWAFLDPERTRQRDARWYDGFMSHALEHGKLPHVKQTMRTLVRTQTKQIAEAELRRIDIPTSLLWGRHDRMVPLRIAECAAEKFGWPLDVVDDVGHVPFIEEPAAFLRALAEVRTP